jgi:hypothetical protein
MEGPPGWGTKASLLKLRPFGEKRSRAGGDIDDHHA